jgi:hypothetical protein
VKARVFQYLPLCVFLLAACGPTASQRPADAITFDTLKGLDDFEFATAGDGKPGEWSIIENDGGRVLAQTDTDPADNRFPLAIYRRFSGRDVYVSIRFMTISGETDQAAGVFVRFASVDDYYVARASALENSVGLYRVVAGKREMIGYMEINVSGRAWHRGARRTPHGIFRRQGAFCRDRQEVSGAPRQSWLVDQSRQHDLV